MMQMPNLAVIISGPQYRYRVRLLIFPRKIPPLYSPNERLEIMQHFI